MTYNKNRFKLTMSSKGKTWNLSGTGAEDGIAEIKMVKTGEIRYVPVDLLLEAMNAGFPMVTCWRTREAALQRCENAVII